MKTRKFVVGALNHVYFVTSDGGVLFYLNSDRLFFYSMLAVLSKRYKVIIVGISIMFTHVHLMVRAQDKAQFVLFMREVIRTLSRILRQDRGWDGPLLKTPFGSAPRVTSKQHRSSMIYLLNNPVEKRLCNRAVEDRWTFLAYYNGDINPFSKPLVKRYASKRLRNACAVIDAEVAVGRYLRPTLLRNLSQGLLREEQEQLADYVIRQFACIDYREGVAIFDGYDKMLQAADATTGKEFDIGEVFDPDSDIPYREMIRMAASAHLFDGWKLLHLNRNEQIYWMKRFRAVPHANAKHIGRFLHLKDIPY